MIKDVRASFQVFFVIHISSLATHVSSNILPIFKLVCLTYYLVVIVLNTF